MKSLIKFLKENINVQDVSSAIDKMYATRYPLYVVDSKQERLWEKELLSMAAHTN